ncbi:MAG: galactokinase, partial [Clostridia bacterium]|nr:galactokinase [Clostridia bacterium]
MNAKELIAKLEGGALSRHADLYRDIPAETERYIKAIKRFTELFGEREDVVLFSVPGRSEISGNHTDHNHGCVLAGAIDRDIIAVTAKTDDGEIRLISEGYP